MSRNVGAVETFPAGATLTGIVVDGEVIRPYRLKPNIIEVHEDTITFLYRRGFGNLAQVPYCEIGVKVGTVVEWEI